MLSSLARTTTTTTQLPRHLNRLEELALQLPWAFPIPIALVGRHGRRNQTVASNHLRCFDYTLSVSPRPVYAFQSHSGVALNKAPTPSATRIVHDTYTLHSTPSITGLSMHDVALVLHRTRLVHQGGLLCPEQAQDYVYEKSADSNILNRQPNPTSA
ncbi:hypothetical protein BDZ89DRAFT_197922 [Hymenopellis radicata]|nr:hypothetical protein BDZ89DRAFT_197922 [Hymenopellis radicata]